MKRRDDIAWLKRSYAKGVGPTEQRECAEVEARVWKTTSRAMRAGKREKLIKPVFFKQLGCPSGHAAEDRSLLWRAGPPAEPIWAAIRRGALSVRLGADVMREAKRTKSQTGASITQCVEESVKRKLQERRKKGRPLWSYHDRERKVRSPNKPKTTEEQRLRSRVRELAADFVRAELRVGPAEVQEQLIREVEGEVAALVGAFVRRVKLRRNQLSGTLEALSRRKLASACEQLGLPAPSVRNPLDYDLARRHYRRLASRHHPDVNSAPGAVETYRAVNEAMDVIEQWREQNNLQKGT